MSTEPRFEVDVLSDVVVSGAWSVPPPALFPTRRPRRPFSVSPGHGIAGVSLGAGVSIGDNALRLKIDRRRCRCLAPGIASTLGLARARLDLSPNQVLAKRSGELFRTRLAPAFLVGSGLVGSGPIRSGCIASALHRAKVPGGSSVVKAGLPEA